MLKDYLVTFTPTFYGKPITIKVSALSAEDAEQRIAWMADDIQDAEP